MDLSSLYQKYLSFLEKVLPKPSRPNVIGIDIGTSSIKAVEIVVVSGAYEISNWAVERIEGADALGALKKVTQRLALTAKAIPVAAVSGKGTLIRYVDLPRMPLEDLRKSFTYDLDKYFPFDPQTIYTDCCILDEKGKDKKMPVLITAVKKEMVEEKIGLFKEAGFPISHITTNSIATANAFERVGPKLVNSNNAKAVLDIGGAVSSLTIVQNHTPRFTRDIFIGSQELTQQIARSLGVDEKQAESVKMAPGDQTDQIIAVCDGPINNLIAEIRLSMDYFMTEKNAQIDELFLVGGGSLLKGIEGSFEKNLGMPVRIWNPLGNIRLSDNVAKSDINAYASQLGVALGLGLVNI